MRLKAIFILCCFLHLAYALTLNEAISLTLNANAGIKEQEYLLQESKYNTKTQYAPFYPNFNITYRADKSNRLNSRSKDSSSTLSLDVTYNLFNGLSDIFNLKSAQALQVAQSYQLESVKEDVILFVKRAYIDILRQKQNVLVATQSKELLEEQRRESAEFYKVGLIPKNDLLKVEVELHNSIQTLLNAQSNLNYAIKTLERYTRTKIDSASLEELTLHTPPLLQSNLQNTMHQKRAEVLFLDNIIRSKEYLSKSIQGRFLPSIDILGSYSQYGDDYKLQERIDTYNDQKSAQLQFNLNVFNGFSDKFELEASKANKLAYESQKIDLLEELDLQLFSALENYNLAISAYEVAKKALIQAEENYRISQNRYKERIESTSDFLDSEYLLTQARSNVVLNRYAILQALAEIERITQSKITQY
ncbi:TolC family protein [Helicobacter burdigaliensis]|uniref:TolC family protein n=1 Tax=Helicobacter burdigaliensis TaxID=2315334 RepID=UPI000EF73D75|nr:TolC family protein [Helicobacter burdigaliensis]